MILLKPLIYVLFMCGRPNSPPLLYQYAKILAGGFLMINLNDKAIPRRNMNYKWDEMLTANPHSIQEDLIPFTVAEMEWMTDSHIIEAVQEYMGNCILGYTFPNEDYYQAVGDWLRDNYGLKVAQEDIVMTPGVITALRTAIQIMTEENDGVIVLTPSYQSFFKIINETKRTLVNVSLTNHDGNYTLNTEALESAFANPNNKMMILCNPHNPVGHIWTHDELSTLAQLSSKYNVPVVSDEIHADLIMPGYTFTSYADFDPQAIICTAPSKTFNLAGLKLSNIIIKDLALRNKFVTHASRYGAMGVNALAIVATHAAYTQGRPWLDTVITQINKNASIIQETFSKTEAVVSPLEATYLMWIDFRPYTKDHPELIQKFIDNGVFVHEGSLFGEDGKNFIRMNIATPQHYIEKACTTMLDIINKL